MHWLLSPLRPTRLNWNLWNDKRLLLHWHFVKTLCRMCSTAWNAIGYYGHSRTQSLSILALHEQLNICQQKKSLVDRDCMGIHMAHVLTHWPVQRDFMVGLFHHLDLWPHSIRGFIRNKLHSRLMLTLSSPCYSGTKC